MQGGDTMAMINAIWPFILMGGIFYFMLYRPQKQEQQKRQRMLDSLKKGVINVSYCGTKIASFFV